MFAFLLQHLHQICCLINAAPTGFHSVPAFILHDAWQRAYFFSKPERLELNPRSNPGCLHLQRPRAQVYPGVRGPHTLQTASLVGVTSEPGAASLPFTIISLATLPCWCWWRPWTNTAIWIQLVEFSSLWVSVRARPWAERKRVGNFNSRVVTSTLKRRRFQRGKNDKIIAADVAVGL